MFNDLIADFQNNPFRAPEGSIPLFVDVGAQVVFTAAFQNNLISGYPIYSSLPIIVCSTYYPNILFSLIPEKELISLFKRIKKKINCLNYSKFSFDYINNILNENELYAFGLPNDTKNEKDQNLFNERIYNICVGILNPLGIGAFYSKGFNFLSALPEKEDATKMSCEFLPYSMEIVRKMLFRFKNEEFSPFSIASLMILRYPLPKIAIPKPNLKILKDRFIFSKFIINNPPLIEEGDHSQLKSFKIARELEPKDCHYLCEIKPYQWVHIEIQTFQEHFQPNEKIEAFIGDVSSKELNVFECILDPKIQKEFINYEVDIMHPNGGKLHLTGIKMSCGDSPIFVDVFVEGKFPE